MRRAAVTVRNTFLAFDDGEEEQLAWDRPFSRSKSVGDEPEGAQDSQQDGMKEDDLRLAHLNRLLRKDPASTGHMVAPLSEPASPGEGDAEVWELRQLQRRLREAAMPRAAPPKEGGRAPRAVAPPEAPPRALAKVTSNASVSTMVPEDTDAARGGALRPSLPNAGSSNSISSMVSDWAMPSLREVGSSSSVSAMASEAPPRGEDGLGESPAARPWAEPRRRRAPPAPKDYCHGQVPRKCDLANEFARSAQEGPPTTLMIRNIPNHYTQISMVRELEGLGFQDSYDFLYVPLDKGTMGSVGYCFVNFVSPEWASRCAQVFEGRPFERQRRDRRNKVAMVSVAHLQGLEANIRHYRNAAVTSTGNQGKSNGPIVIANLARSLG